MIRGFKVEGARELQRVLNQLPKAVARDAMRRAILAGANVVRKEVKSTAPMRTKVYLNDKQARRYGHLRDNIKVRVKGHSDGVWEAIIHNNDAFWGLFVEFGYDQPSNPFFTRAFEASVQPAFNKIGIRLGTNIERAAAMLAGRIKKTKTFKKKLAKG